MNYKETVTKTLMALVQPMSDMLINDSEVVLHDLDKLPNSVIAIAGNLTGRKVGGAAPDIFIERFKRGDLATDVGQQSVLLDGRHLRSSTMLINDEDGAPMLALCVNLDVTIWRDLGAIANTIFSHEALSPLQSVAQAAVPEPPQPPKAEPLHDIDELANLILDEVVNRSGIPVKYMHKDQKVRIVAELKHRGFFGLREAAERAAEVLQVSRFTIYNYLKELEEQETAPMRDAL